MKALSFILAIIVGHVPTYVSAGETYVVGWAERAAILPENLVLEAKVDTGAGNTSIDARNITPIDRKGKKIIRFDVDNREGQTVTLERVQVGIETVLHLGKFQERPLVILEICLGNDCRETLVNLADRSRLKFPLLIGRSFMLDRIVVNPSAQFTLEPLIGAPTQQ